MNIRAVCFALAWVAPLCGCHELHDGFQEKQSAHRNSLRAKCAWWRARACYKDIDERHHFGEGFRAGYYDVASGGDGTPPMLPPRKYWGPRYQSASGHLKTVAWFDGFEHGAVAALQDGAGQWQQIVTRNAVRGSRPPEDWLERPPLGETPQPAADPALPAGSAVPPEPIPENE